MPSDVVSFRPTREEAAIIERTKRRLRLRSRTAALRHLVRAGAAKEDKDPDGLERLFALRAPPEFRAKGRSITSEEIDEVVYGDHLRHGSGSG